jgi:hypothetical protein
MNRILLIGNGFDLAHKLKTGYSDFINDFWEKEKEKVIHNLQIDPMEKNYFYKDDVVEVKSHYQIQKSNTNGETLKGYKWFQQLPSLSIHSHDGIEHSNKVSYINNFLYTITDKESIQNWVDIEHEYYLSLNECLDVDKDIEKLNMEFSYIQNSLVNYLKSQISDNVIIFPAISNHIYSNIPKIPNKNTLKVEGTGKILFLNFNYTNTEKYYINDNHSNTIVHIHGELDNPSNPIIFGYGD